MKGISMLMIVASVAAFSQEWQVGATAGFSAVGASDLVTTSSASAGVQVCGLCAGRVAAFAEYNHVETFGGDQWGIKRYDIAAAGVRIQGLGRILPFFYAGFAYGVDHFGRDGERKHGNPGMVLAGGVTFLMKNKWYIRPQYRMYGFTWYHAVAGGNVEVGFRF